MAGPPLSPFSGSGTGTEAAARGVAEGNRVANGTFRIEPAPTLHAGPVESDGRQLVELRIRPDYVEFIRVLVDAYEQTASGKGDERHGGGTPWCGQPIMTELRYQKHPGFAIGQARKKLLESLRLPRDHAYAERLGAIVYTVAAAMFGRDAQEKS